MTPATLQRIGELYLLTTRCPAPLTAGEVAAHEAAKLELQQLSAGGVYNPWRTDLPDDAMTVLVCCPDADEPVWPAYRMDGDWYWVDGMRVNGEVVGWQHLPEPTGVGGKEREAIR